MSQETARAYVFDLDDTLVNTIGPKFLAHKAAAREYSGLELTDDDLKAVWGKPFRPMVCELYRTDDFDGVMTCIQATRELYPKIPHEGALDKLVELRAQGILLGIVTSMSREGVKHDFTTLPFDENWFEFIQTEDDTEHHKPDKRVFEPVLEHFEAKGITNADIMYVGDHWKDFFAARDAKINFTGVATGLLSIADFTKLGAHAVPSVAHIAV